MVELPKRCILDGIIHFLCILKHGGKRTGKKNMMSAAGAVILIVCILAAAAILYQHHFKPGREIDGLLSNWKEGKIATIMGENLKIGMPEPGHSYYQYSEWDLGDGMEKFPSYWDTKYMKKALEFGCGGPGDERHRSQVDEVFEYNGVLEKN